SAMPLMNSKNWVACTIEYGIPDVRIRASSTSFARKYPAVVFAGSPPSDSPCVPTTERAMWWPTPAAASATSRLWVEVAKNSSAVRYSKLAEFETSTTAEAPSRAAARPSPVIVLTPSRGDAGTASCPFSARMATTFEPMSPVPPITTIFMDSPSFLPMWCRRPGPRANLVEHARKGVSGPTRLLTAFPGGFTRRGRRRSRTWQEGRGCRQIPYRARQDHSLGERRLAVRPAGPGCRAWALREIHWALRATVGTAASGTCILTHRRG